MQRSEIPRPADLGLDSFVSQWRRRSFLRGSLMLAGAASSGLLLGCQPANTPVGSAAPMLMKVLNRLEPVALPDVPPLVPASRVDIDRYIQELLALMDPQILKDLDGAATLFEFGSSVLGWHFARFTSLADADVMEYVERWQNGVSMQRAIVTVFKKLLYASYWRDPATWVPLSFDGPVSVKWGLPSLGNAPFPDDLTAVKEAV